MVALLMLFAVALLARPAVSSPRRCHNSQPNLDRMFEIIVQNFTSYLNRSSTVHPGYDEYVEDVSNLTQGSTKCQDGFFCKVYNILHKQAVFRERTAEKEFVKNLQQYNICRNVSCTAVLKDVPHVTNEIQLRNLMPLMIRCIQQKNYSGADRTTVSPNV